MNKVQFKTETGSMYEVDYENSRIRRLSGVKDPTSRQGKDGEWRTYQDLILKKGSNCFIFWDPKTTPLLEGSIGGEPSTITSPVKEIMDIMPRYTITDMWYNMSEVIVNQEISDRASAITLARLRLEKDYADELVCGPVWARLAIACDGEDDGVTTIVLQQTAPECPHEGGHEWEQDSVRGHGGGVLIREVCAHCGAVQVTDTWASCPDTGEEGFRVVSYG